MSNIQDIYNIRKQMKQLYNKLELLYRKKKSFGLTDDETSKLNEYRNLSWILHEELIETHLNITVMPYLETKQSKQYLNNIKQIIPWDGNLIRRDNNLDSIYKSIETLNNIDKQIVDKNLKDLHEIIMNEFEDFCSTENGYDHIREASKVITDEKDGNVLDVLVYLDAKYREFADLLDIELQTVEVMWEEEE